MAVMIPTLAATATTAIRTLSQRSASLSICADRMTTVVAT
jgi:hypothetical protein